MRILSIMYSANSSLKMALITSSVYIIFLKPLIENKVNMPVIEDLSTNPTDFKYVTPFLPIGKGSLDLTSDITTTMFYNGASANDADPGLS